MVLLLRQCGEIIRRRKSPTCERDDPFAQAKNLRFQGLERDDRALRTVAASGLPVPAASSKSRFALACSGAEKCLHGQTFSNLNRAGSPPSSAAALFDQRLGGAGPALGAGAVQIPWLNPQASENCVAKSITCRIVMCSRRSLKCIVGWCPGRRPQATNRRGS